MLFRSYSPARVTVMTARTGTRTTAMRWSSEGNTTLDSVTVEKAVPEGARTHSSRPVGRVRRQQLSGSGNQL